MTLDTWTYGDDYREQTLTRRTDHGIFRAIVRRDDYPDAPEFEAGCPVYAYGDVSYGYEMEDSPRYGADSDRHSGIDFPNAFAHFYERQRFYDALGTLDRWLRIFHGGSLRQISSTVWQGEPWYLTYDTRAMRAYWGQTGEMLETSAPEADEWQAYIDGDVYSVDVEQATAFDDDGEPVAWESVDFGPIHGFYGEKWAREEAEGMLADAIGTVSQDMLPLG